MAYIPFWQKGSHGLPGRKNRQDPYIRRRQNFRLNSKKDLISREIRSFFYSISATFSQNRISMVATWARVALPPGSSRPLPMPEMSPTPTAQLRVSAA